MDESRRRFLKIIGLSTLGLAGTAMVEASAAGKVDKYLSYEQAFAGKKWAMVIDLSKAARACDGCRDCIDACHSIHNVPTMDLPKNEVKWIWKDDFEHAFPAQTHHYLEQNYQGRPSIVLCNHCDNPPCVRVCPTKATFKRADGIVAMDYHRCIGCRYCMSACPYGSRSLNWRDPREFLNEIDKEFPTRTRGVVEKCNFCVERLAQGLMPACVAACKEGVLSFGDLNDPASDVSALLSKHHTIRRKPHLGTQPRIYYIV